MACSVYLYLGVINLISFILYGVDKRRAIKHKWRIPEATLLLFAFFGGAAGALLGMLVFHHKTSKRKFRILVPIALVLWISGIFWTIFYLRW
ncbi:MAG: DUF1294 domain-containing protein [Eubacterium sp.]|nr:DUF1294 domain-containing protein [Eubacterium sp.]